MLQKDLYVLLVGVVRKLGYALDEGPPGLGVGALERIVVPLGPGQMMKFAPTSEQRSMPRFKVSMPLRLKVSSGFMKAPKA